MANLAPDLTAKLRQSVKDQGLTFRNWSGPDAWVFAIYSEGDNYVGCVEVVESTRTMRVRVSNTCRPIRREAEILGKLCAAFNRL